MADTDQKFGYIATVSAFLIWGLAPIYFKSVAEASAFEILTHRIIWSVPLLLVIVFWKKRDLKLLLEKQQLPIYFLSACLIGTNWFLFIWGVNAGKMVEVSLGYYINPLINVLLGVLFLSERLDRFKAASVLLAAIGVVILVLMHGSLPWISLALAASFGTYALLRKAKGIDPLIGILAETLILAPIAAGYLIWLVVTGANAFIAISLELDVLLLLASVITAVPLILFMEGAKRLPLSTVGLIQYIGPTLMLILGVFVYHEEFDQTQLIAFSFIWLALIVFTLGGFWSYRKKRRLSHA